jgi:hypothetical protein
LAEGLEGNGSCHCFGGVRGNAMDRFSPTPKRLSDSECFQVLGGGELSRDTKCEKTP